MTMKTPSAMRPELASQFWTDFINVTEAYPQFPAAGAAKWGRFTLSLIANDQITLRQSAELTLGPDKRRVLQATIGAHAAAQMSPESNKGVAGMLDFAAALPQNVALATIAVLGGYRPDGTIPMVRDHERIFAFAEQAISTDEGMNRARGVFAILDGVFRDPVVAGIAGKDGHFGNAIKAAKDLDEKNSVRAALAFRLETMIDTSLLEFLAPVNTEERKAIASCMTMFVPSPEIAALIPQQAAPSE